MMGQPEYSWSSYCSLKPDVPVCICTDKVLREGVMEQEWCHPNPFSFFLLGSASNLWKQEWERGLSPEDLPADHPGSSYQVYPLLAVGNCWGWAWICVCDETTLVLLPDGVVLSQRVETPGGQMGCLKRAEVPWQGLHGLKPQAGGCMKVFF